jgi:ectoine hydroxylase-related dioxygenase (phytanoyl-CoA dioxygenase family)
MPSILADPALTLDQRAIARFRHDGFTVIRGLFDAEEVARYRAASLAISTTPPELPWGADAAYKQAFTQVVNPWRTDPVVREMTFHPRLIAAAQQLAGRPIRLWHDQILTKEARNGRASEFHQDQPFWPLGRAIGSYAAWIALGDTPEEHGCMRFIPGSQRHRDLPAQFLTRKGHLFELCPELAQAERVCIPLRAGDVTFHDGFTAHEAGANQLEHPRVAHSVIFVDAGARYLGGGHFLTDAAGCQPGDDLPADICPLL